MAEESEASMADPKDLRDLAVRYCGDDQPTIILAGALQHAAATIEHLSTGPERDGGRSVDRKDEVTTQELRALLAAAEMYDSANVSTWSSRLDRDLEMLEAAEEAADALDARDAEIARLRAEPGEAESRAKFPIGKDMRCPLPCNRCPDAPFHRYHDTERKKQVHRESAAAEEMKP